MLKIKQYLCRHKFKVIAEHVSCQENLWQCDKCKVYVIQHYGLGISYKCKAININGWNKTKRGVNITMKPTIGRLVYYKGLNGNEYAALVSQVNSDTCLGLHVFYPQSQPTFIANVEQGYDDGQWDWMPYQKQQAVSTPVVTGDANGNDSN